MQGQGAGLRVLTMVLAQRWGQGRGPEVARLVCGERCQSRNPAHTAPPPGGSPEASSGPRLRVPRCKGGLRLVLRGKEEALTTAWASVHTDLSEAPSAARAEAHTAPGESRVRPPRRSLHPLLHGLTHLSWEEVPGLATPAATESQCGKSGLGAVSGRGAAPPAGLARERCVSVSAQLCVPVCEPLENVERHFPLAFPQLQPEGTGIGSGHPKTRFSAQRSFICPEGTKDYLWIER